MTYPDYTGTYSQDSEGIQQANPVLNSVRAANLVPDDTSAADLQIVVLDRIRQELQEIKRAIRNKK